MEKRQQLHKNTFSFLSLPLSPISTIRALLRPYSAFSGELLVVQIGSLTNMYSTVTASKLLQMMMGQYLSFCRLFGDQRKCS